MKSKYCLFLILSLISIVSKAESLNIINIKEENKIEKSIEDSINQRINMIKEKEKEMSKTKENKQEEKEIEEDKKAESIVYTDIDSKRVKPYVYIDNVSWKLEDNQYMKDIAATYKMDLTDENIIERFSIPNLEELFNGVRNGDIKEIEMTSNGKNSKYIDCTSGKRKTFIYCSDPNNLGSLTMRKKNDNTVIVNQKNGYGEFEGLLINGEGYNIDLTTTEVIFIHD